MNERMPALYFYPKGTMMRTAPAKPRLLLSMSLNNKFQCETMRFSSVANTMQVVVFLSVPAVRTLLHLLCSWLLNVLFYA